MKPQPFDIDQDLPYHVAADGAQGVAKLTASAVVFDAIIAVTCRTTDAERALSLGAGMSDHLGKPFDSHALVDVILRRVAAKVTVPLPIPPSVLLATDNPAGQLAQATEGALERLGGDWVLYAQLCKAYPAHLPPLAQLFNDWWDDRGHMDLKRLLHSLKGSSSTVGAALIADHPTPPDALASDETIRLAAERAVAAMGGDLARRKVT